MSVTKNKLVIIVLEETAWQSFLSDVISLAGFLLLIGVGVWLNSVPMQWAGYLLGIIFAVGQANSHLRTKMRMTPDEAIVHIHEISVKRENK